MLLSHCCVRGERWYQYLHGRIITLNVPPSYSLPPPFFFNFMNLGAGATVKQNSLQVFSLVILALTVGAISGLKVELLQPDFGVDPKKERAKYMLLAKKQFRDKMPAADKILMDIAASSNAVYHTGPSKGDERWLEKANISYGDNLQRVSDIARRSLTFGDFGEMEAALRKIHDSDLTIIRIKNRFAKGNNAKITGAYRDLQLLCYIPGTKMFFEVQLHLNCIHDLKQADAQKKGADGRTGHERYIEFRQIIETAEADFKVAEELYKSKTGESVDYLLQLRGGDMATAIAPADDDGSDSSDDELCL